MLPIYFKILNKDAAAPRKAHDADAGFDLTACRKWVDEYGNICYGTGLAVDIPQGYVGKIHPRSSICKYDLQLSNSVGVIDSGYHGEIMAKFRPTRENGTFYKEGERICQLIIEKLPEVAFVEAAGGFNESERGEGGYGSTGK